MMHYSFENDTFLAISHFQSSGSPISARTYQVPQLFDFFVLYLTSVFKKSARLVAQENRVLCSSIEKFVSSSVENIT